MPDKVFEELQLSRSEQRDLTELGFAFAEAYANHDGELLDTMYTTTKARIAETLEGVAKDGKKIAAAGIIATSLVALTPVAEAATPVARQLPAIMSPSKLKHSNAWIYEEDHAPQKVKETVSDPGDQPKPHAQPKRAVPVESKRSLRRETITEGKTLWGIAHDNHEPLSELEADNPALAARPRHLLPGEKIMVAAPQLAPAPRVKIDVIRTGDSLWKESHDNHLTLEELLAKPFNARYRAHPGLVFPGDQVDISAAVHTRTDRVVTTKPAIPVHSPAAVPVPNKPTPVHTPAAASVPEPHLSQELPNAVDVPNHPVHKKPTPKPELHKPESIHKAQTIDLLDIPYTIHTSILLEPGVAYTGVTAAQLDQYFAGSGLEGLGQTVLETALQHGINPLYIAMRITLESGHGNSSITQATNNVAGVNAFDTCPAACAKHYHNKADSVRDFVNLLATKYLHPGEPYYSGPTPHDIDIHYSTAGDGAANAIVNMMNEYTARFRQTPPPHQTPPALKHKLTPPSPNQQPLHREPSTAEIQAQQAAAQRAAIVRTAFAFENNAQQPNAAYMNAIHAEENKGIYMPYGGEDCGAFVGAVMRSSGVDPNYMASDTSNQSAYAIANPEKYNVSVLNNMSQLKPGDVLIVNRGDGVGAKGHTLVYVGEQSNGTNAIAASGDDAWPRPSNVNMHDPRGPYKIIEVKG